MELSLEEGSSAIVGRMLWPTSTSIRLQIGAEK
jgi:hypothetical protein